MYTSANSYDKRIPNDDMLSCVAQPILFTSAMCVYTVCTAHCAVIVSHVIVDLTYTIWKIEPFSSIFGKLYNVILLCFAICHTPFHSSLFHFPFTTMGIEVYSRRINNLKSDYQYEIAKCNKKLRKKIQKSNKLKRPNY